LTPICRDSSENGAEPTDARSAGRRSPLGKQNVHSGQSLVSLSWVYFWILTSAWGNVPRIAREEKSKSSSPLLKPGTNDDQSTECGFWKAEWQNGKWRRCEV